MPSTKPKPATQGLRVRVAEPDPTTATRVARTIRSRLAKADAVVQSRGRGTPDGCDLVVLTPSSFARTVDENRALREEVERLRALTEIDPLTGLLNRRGLVSRLEELFASASRYGADLSCMVADLDGLKGVNDTLGHAQGDALLAAFARVLRRGSRRSDVVARIGGDEFVVLLPHTPAASARRIADRLAAAFTLAVAPVQAALDNARPCERRRGPSAEPRSGRIGVSFGIAGLAETRARLAAELIARADAALYAAKSAGGRRAELAA